MPNRKPFPVLRSLPITDKIELPPRAELIPKIESGELDHIDFPARVYRTDTKNKNPYIFKSEDLETFAASFEGQLFLRNHDTQDIDARDGTIIDSALEGSVFKQTIRLTTRRGMLDFIEGKIDRFSIGWYYDDVTCSICNLSYIGGECSHWAGRKYKVTETREEICKLIFINPKGKETSAVNTPAVEGTGIDILQELNEYKLEVVGDVTAVTHARRASNSKRKGVQTMPKAKSPQPAAALDADLEQLENSEQLDAALVLQGANERLAAMQKQQEMQNEIHIANLRALLDNSLAASKLPAASQKAVRKSFASKLDAGEVFLPTELQEAIADKRTELAELQESQVQGPARGNISAMFSGIDQFHAALADLLQAPRPEGLANLKVRRLSGIREAYILGTGDRELMGGFYPEFALEAADFTRVTADLLNKTLLDAWRDYEDVYGWWKLVTKVENFSNLQDIKWLKTGTIGSLPTVARGGEYQELPIGDNKETSTWYKYGGYIAILLEDIINDDVRALRRLPREAALGGIRNISEQVAAIFTVNSGAGPTLADTGALFNATATTTVGGHANLLTTALGTDYTAWEAAASAIYNQALLVKNGTGYVGTGKKQAIDPKYILTSRALRGAANNLFLERARQGAQYTLTSGKEWYGEVVPLTVPEWTDATDWAAVVEPKYCECLMIGEMFGITPQIYAANSNMDPAMFANDESRIKVRQFLNVGVADYRGLHKNNVAG